ncbi:MAG: polysaccharide deacetylase, partial [Dehalococcoidia bacterium]|nr:polysaccharide deacetylase [Dehalococcoidia bacterium]
ESPRGDMCALPMRLELDDVVSLWQRRVTVGRYLDMITEGFDTLYQDGNQTGRLMTLNLHPWLIGQPFRIGYLGAALAHMTRRGGVWAATGSEIIDWFQKNLPVA